MRINSYTDHNFLSVQRGDNSYYLEHDFLHFLVGRLELSYEDQHDFSCVVVSVLGVHERYEISDGLEEGGQTFTPVLPDALPQRFQHTVEGLDTIGCGCLG